MEEKIKNLFKKGVNLIIIIGAFGSAFLFLIYVFRYLPKIASFINTYISQILISILFIWISILTFF